MICTFSIFPFLFVVQWYQSGLYVYIDSHFSRKRTIIEKCMLSYTLQISLQQKARAACRRFHAQGLLGCGQVRLQCSPTRQQFQVSGVP